MFPVVSAHASISVLEIVMYKHMYICNCNYGCKLQLQNAIINAAEIQKIKAYLVMVLLFRENIFLIYFKKL